MDASDLDGVVPRGWAPDKLRRYPEITDLVKTVYNRDKTDGIICHGRLVAISAGIVDGARATGSLGIKDDLENADPTSPASSPCNRELTGVAVLGVLETKHTQCAPMT